MASRVLPGRGGDGRVRSAERQFAHNSEAKFPAGSAVEQFWRSSRWFGFEYRGRVYQISRSDERRNRGIGGLDQAVNSMGAKITVGSVSNAHTTEIRLWQSYPRESLTDRVHDDCGQRKWWIRQLQLRLPANQCPVQAAAELSTISQNSRLGAIPCPIG